MINKRASGLKAKKAGQAFEQIFHAVCNRYAIVCTEIPDGCFRVSTPKGLLLRPCTTPFDFLICKSGKAAAIDCKTLDEDSFSYSNLVEHQVQSLYDIGGHIPAGYVVWFRPCGNVVFFDHIKLRTLQPRASLKSSDGILLGPIKNFDPLRILRHGTNPTFQHNLF